MADQSGLLGSRIGVHGAHGLENPKDPGFYPYATAWLLDEIYRYCSHDWASGVDVDLCRFGWISRKPTHVHGHIRGLSKLGLLCNHPDGHPPLCGRDAAGNFRTTPAQRYTSAFCALLAELLVDTLADVLVCRGELLAANPVAMD